MRLSGVLVLFIAIAAAARFTSAAEPITLAVVDLQDKGAGLGICGNLTDTVTVALSKLGVFRVLSRADIQKMLEMEQQKQMLGCDDASCLAEIGGALGVGLLVTGSVGKVGTGFIVNLTLTDTTSVEVKAREQRQVSREEDLMKEVEGATRFLVRDLLRGKQGELILTTVELGAEVEIDGRLIGVTPLGRQTLAGGPHTVKVHKKGFVTWANDVDIESDQPAVVNASLVPSLDFIAEYDSRARLYRIFAWVATGIGVGALGFGVAGYVWNNDRAATYERDLARDNCMANPPDAPTVDCTGYESRRQEIMSFSPVVLAALISGVAIAGTGLALFLIGPEVGVYDQYKSVSEAGPVAVAVMPLSDGVAASAAFRF